MRWPRQTAVERAVGRAMDELRKQHPRCRFIVIALGTGEYDYLRIDRDLTPSHARMIFEDAAKNARRKYGRKQKWSSVSGVQVVRA